VLAASLVGVWASAVKGTLSQDVGRANPGRNGAAQPISGRGRDDASPKSGGYGRKR
jgi:hypothetical protein